MTSAMCPNNLAYKLSRAHVKHPTKKIRNYIIDLKFNVF